jgi:hypothetical protein
MKLFFAFVVMFLSSSAWSKGPVTSSPVEASCVAAVASRYSYVRARNTPALLADAKVKVRDHIFGATNEVSGATIEVIEKNGEQIRIQYLNKDGRIYDMLILDDNGNAQYVKPDSRINKSLNIDKIAHENAQWAAYYISEYIAQRNSSVADISDEAAYKLWRELKKWYPSLFRR